MNTLIKNGKTYLTSTGYDRIIMFGNYIEQLDHNTTPTIDFKTGEFDLNTKELTSKVLNLGKDLLMYIGNDLQNTYIDFLNHDFLKQKLIDYDFKNHLIISDTIVKWYKDTIYPFNNLYNDEYTFASICIRLYAILKCFNKIITRKENTSSARPVGEHRNDLYFLFNDYIIEDMDENDYSKYTAGCKKVNHKIDDDIVLKYINRLFNDINTKHSIWSFSKKLIINKDNKNDILLYYTSPISAVYNLIATLLCDKEAHIKECQYCGYYMKVDNLHQEYHDECHLKVDLNRKKKDKA